MDGLLHLQLAAQCARSSVKISLTLSLSLTLLTQNIVRNNNMEVDDDDYVVVSHTTLKLKTKPNKTNICEKHKKKKQIRRIKYGPGQLLLLLLLLFLNFVVVVVAFNNGVGWHELLQLLLLPACRQRFASIFIRLLNTKRNGSF